MTSRRRFLKTVAAIPAVAISGKVAGFSFYRATSNMRPETIRLWQKKG